MRRFEKLGGDLSLMSWNGTFEESSSCGGELRIRIQSMRRPASKTKGGGALFLSNDSQVSVGAETEQVVAGFGLFDSYSSSNSSTWNAK